MSLIPNIKDAFLFTLGNNNNGNLNLNLKLFPKGGVIVISKRIIKFAFTLLLFWALIFLVAGKNVIYAQTDYYIPGGETIGIQLDTGVYVAGKYEVQTTRSKVSPWRKSDIDVGDKIMEIDKVEVMNNNDVMKRLQVIDDDNVILTLQRKNIIFDTSVDLVTTKSGERSIGLYIKDKVLGIGTITFIDPNNHSFASLGHAIYDQKIALGSIDGTIYTSSIASIKKALPGTPGEKRAVLGNSKIGEIALNNATGLYGVLSQNAYQKKKALPAATQEEVKLGKAEILTVVKNNKIESYDVEVVEINHQTTRSIKGLKIRITDKDLIAETGGIVQGMSGSPIIQNDKIIGAVSHVTVDNPLVGYGMHIEWMIDDINKVN